MYVQKQLSVQYIIMCHLPSLLHHFVKKDKVIKKALEIF